MIAGGTRKQRKAVVVGRGHNRPLTLTTSGADWGRFDRLDFLGEAEAVGAILRRAKRGRYIIILFSIERGAGVKRGSQGRSY